MLPGSFKYHQYNLETLVISEQRYMLTQGYAITYETSR